MAKSPAVQSVLCISDSAPFHFSLFLSEFVKITKKNEVQKYRSSASKGVVEHVSFRGDKMELRVRVNDTVLLAKRDLEENRIFVGETVDVFLYRIFVTVGDKAYLLENQSLQENSVVI